MPSAAITKTSIAFMPIHSNGINRYCRPQMSTWHDNVENLDLLIRSSHYNHTQIKKKIEIIRHDKLFKSFMKLTWGKPIGIPEYRRLRTPMQLHLLSDKHSWSYTIVYLRELLQRNKIALVEVRRENKHQLPNDIHYTPAILPFVQWRTIPKMRRAKPKMTQCFSLSEWP